MSHKFPSLEGYGVDGRNWALSESEDEKRTSNSSVSAYHSLKYRQAASKILKKDKYDLLAVQPALPVH